MAQCIVKAEESLEITFGEAFENVDCRIDLCEEVFSTKVSIDVLASLEDNTSLPEDKLVLKGRGKHGRRTHRCHASGPTPTSRNPRS